MTELLTELLEAGLIENLGGDDARLEKIEKAVGVVAQELREQPPRLIRAVLAGLDPDVPADDPAIAQAKRALVAEWRSMSSVYTDTPIGLLRAILLEACSQVAEEGDKAAILWLTAADTLPLRRLSGEEQAVHKMLETCASRAERAAIAIPNLPNTPERANSGDLTVSFAVADLAAHTVDRQALRLQVFAAAGPHTQQGRNLRLPDPNPHWPNEGSQWSWQFAERMSVLLANELDALAGAMQQQTQLALQLKEPMLKLVQQIEAELRSRDRLLQDALSASESRIQAEKLRLDALWWSEALYSPSLRRSYREMAAPLAAVIMAVDLLAYVPSLSPASVGYVLAEAVNRLPNADFERKQGVKDLLVELRELRGRIPRGWMSTLDTPPADGRLSLRDAIVQSLQDSECDVDALLRRAGIASDISLSLPAVAHAVFRQEQAVRLAGGGK